MIEAIKNYNNSSSHLQQAQQNSFAQKNLLKVLGSLKEVVMLNITISDILNGKNENSIEALEEL